MASTTLTPVAVGDTWVDLETGPMVVYCKTAALVLIHVGPAAPTSPDNREYIHLEPWGGSNSFPYSGAEKVWARCPGPDPATVLTLGV